MKDNKNIKSNEHKGETSTNNSTPLQPQHPHRSKDCIGLDEISYTPDDKDIEEITCCKVINHTGIRILISKLGTERDLYRALSYIQAYFESEKGAVTTNAIANFICDYKYPKKRFTNTSKEEDLYPLLIRECKEIVEKRYSTKCTIEEIAQQQQIKKQKILFYLQKFEEKWKTTNLPLNSATSSTEHLQLPEEISTDRAKKYFAKALDAGIIERSKDGGYRKVGITKAQLGYFLERIYKPDAKGEDGNKLPEAELNKLFRENRLGRAIDQYHGNVNGDGRPKGYKKIDVLFDE